METNSSTVIHQFDFDENKPTHMRLKQQPLPLLVLINDAP